MTLLFCTVLVVFAILLAVIALYFLTIRSILREIRQLPHESVSSLLLEAQLATSQLLGCPIRNRR